MELIDNEIRKGFKKYVHYDTDMEEYVLGSILLEEDVLRRVRICLSDDHFYSDNHSKLFGVLCEMWDTGCSIDILTVNNYVHRQNKLNLFKQIGTFAYFLTGLTRSVVGTAHAEYDSLTLRTMYIERLLMKVQSSPLEGSVVERAEKLQKLLNDSLSLTAVDDWKDMSQVSLSLMRHMENVKGKDLMGVSTGFDDLDRVTFGLQGGQLIVVGARPGCGKTSFGESVALSAAAAGHKVGIVSLEMPDEQLGARMASIYSDIEFQKIYRSRLDDESVFFESLSKMANLPIYISSKTNVTSGDIRSKVYSLRKRSGCDLVIIDYLQLIESDNNKKNETREREVAKISRSLKLLAMDLKIPVMVLCQLNRDVSNNKNGKPKLHNLRESGALEQDADLVMLLHRPIMSGITHNEDGRSTLNEAVFIVEKNRNGPTGELMKHFNPSLMKFSDLEEF